MARQLLIVGDIHGCYDELRALLDAAGVADDDEIIALGDIVDRGPASPQVLAFFRTRPMAQSIMGNHERKHVRSFRGEIQPALSQRITRQQIGEADYPAAVAQMAAFATGLELPEAILVHAFWEPGVPLEHQRESVVVGTLSGEAYLARTYPRPWYELYDGDKPIVVGHLDYLRTGHPLVYRDRVYGLDTSCCRGGALTGLLLPAFRMVSVPSRADYWGEARHRHETETGEGAARAEARLGEHVREALLAGNLPELLAALPAARRARAAAVADAIEADVAAREAQARSAFAELAPTSDSGARRNFARAAEARYPRERALLFALLDGRPLRPLLLRTVDLANLGLLTAAATQGATDVEDDR
jgi:serine/threonine protein phosphatase 1